MTTPLRHLELEICIDSYESAKIAFENGAHRIEVCSNLLEGGTTPSAGLIKLIKDTLPIKMMVMIRPRGGDFIYDENEIQVMIQDIIMVSSLGANGVVFGALTSQGEIDFDLTNQLCEIVPSHMEITFHRAIDLTKNPSISIKNIFTYLPRITNVLTSGGYPTAYNPLSLNIFSDLAPFNYNIIAASGINSTNAIEIINSLSTPTTKCIRLHMSASIWLASKNQYINDRHVKMSSIENHTESIRKVDAEKVKNLLRVAKDAGWNI